MIKKRTFGESEGNINLAESRPDSKRQKIDQYPETENDEWVSHDFEYEDGQDEVLK